MQKKLFTELGLSAELLKAIHHVGYEEASPIQSATIPSLLGGADVVGQSQTGSGKTAAYALPAIERVDVSLKAPQILILCPTRELAVQVAEEVAKLALFKKGVRELPIYGGQSYERQFRGLQQGSQIIIGTPGRVMDHLKRRTLKLDSLSMIILDEADRMLDMGFVDDIRTILSQAPKKRQTVFFSATLPRPIQELIKTFTNNPVNIKIEAQALTVPSIDQVYYEVDRRSKLELLGRLIDLHDFTFGIIFCATKMMVDELTAHLTARGYSADKLHGDVTQASRERVMAKFRKRGFEFLVATDVAARGLDVDDIEVVFNYDLPQDGEDYVHRIGRTGRAGRNGRAITFVAGREIYKLENIMRFTKGRIRRERAPSASEVEEKRANVFLESLRETLEAGKYRRHDALIDGLLESGHTPTDIASALIHLLGEDQSKPAAAPELSSEPRGYRNQDDRRDTRGVGDRPDRGPREGRREFAQDRGERRPDAGRPPRRNEGRSEGNFSRPPREAPSAASHEPGMVRLALNLGREHGINPGEIVGVIAGVTKITKESIGAIHLLPNKTLVDVSEEHAKLVLKKLNGIRLKGQKLAVDMSK